MVFVFLLFSLVFSAEVRLTLDVGFETVQGTSVGFEDAVLMEKDVKLIMEKTTEEDLSFNVKEEWSAAYEKKVTHEGEVFSIKYRLLKTVFDDSSTSYFSAVWVNNRLQGALRSQNLSAITEFRVYGPTVLAKEKAMTPEVTVSVAPSP